MPEKTSTKLKPDIRISIFSMVGKLMRKFPQSGRTSDFLSFLLHVYSDVSLMMIFISMTELEECIKEKINEI